MKPFVKVCESKVLRRGVVVCCGPEPVVKKLFLDPKTFPRFDVSKQLLVKQWRIVEKAWRETSESPGGVLGFTVRDGGDVFVVLPKWDSRVFVHEAYHAAQAVLRIIGTQDEELGAFLVEWLFEEICWAGHGKARTGKGGE